MQSHILIQYQSKNLFARSDKSYDGGYSERKALETAQSLGIKVLVLGLTLVGRSALEFLITRFGNGNIWHQRTCIDGCHRPLDDADNAVVYSVLPMFLLLFFMLFKSSSFPSSVSLCLYLLLSLCATGSVRHCVLSEFLQRGPRWLSVQEKDILFISLE